ncbi:PREDICTED: tapasin-related protein isoform X1 [Chinchilla lanigera]|uniref:tapasin-related protein isoform X1 n=1 Tax=Chinchilla lanigera TaxID=34839 RepID=UPI00038EA599|nr:PREDICTED: tapasin-related protein isoform X1 [Chinchilla lanigera]
MGAGQGWWLLLYAALSRAAGAGTAEPQVAERQLRAVDVILDCFLVTEAEHPRAFARDMNREKALLVLKQVPVLDDGSLEGFTDFQGDTVAKDDPLVIFEASVDGVQIPQATALLHADCSGKVVNCEISHYLLQGRPEATWFMANVQVPRPGPSVSMVMKTLGDADEGAVRQPTLNLPLGPQGTVRTTVEFQVTTLTQSLNFLLGSSASLDCGFSMAPGLDLTSVEWRLQHRGSGQLIHRWKTGQGQGQAKREGATLPPEQLLRAGDASLTLPSLSLKDEGTYICQITTSLYQAQQILQLNIQASPKVQLSSTNDAPLPTLTCKVTGYYPLDMVVTWIRQEGSRDPVQVSGASFSSLRKSMAGTYSISSYLIADPGPTGAIYTCQVTHVSLEQPLMVSTRIDPITEWEMANGVIFASCLFLLALLFLGLQRRQASSTRFVKTLRHSE